MNPAITVPLDKNLEKRLFNFMNQDKISHFYAIHDLRYSREKTSAWVTLLKGSILGYMIEFDKRILYMRGNEECTIPLLRNTNLVTPLFNVEPQHLPSVKRLYKPIAPADKTTIGKITTFMTMRTTRESFKPIIKHDVRALKKEDTKAVAELMNRDVQTALGFLSGFAFGVFQGDKMVSLAASPESLDDLAILRGVFTAPEERNKGYSTSACSALVERLLKDGKDVFLYVSKDNPAAIRVYEKIGFEETGHVFLGFEAKKKD